MLLVVFLLVDDDIPVHKEVIEEEELSGFQLLPACLGEHALAHQHSSGDAEGLPRRPEAALDEGDAPGVGLAVHCNRVA